MFDPTTGWKIGVRRSATAGAYIVAPPRQVTLICGLLAAHRIPHAVEAGAWRGKPRGGQADQVVRLGQSAEADRVQDLLDEVP